jgi:hypothetical protein
VDFAPLDGYTYCQGDWNNCLLVIDRSATWNCCCVSKALRLDMGVSSPPCPRSSRPDYFRGHGFEAFQMSIASMKIVCEE